MQYQTNLKEAYSYGDSAGIAPDFPFNDGLLCRRVNRMSGKGVGKNGKSKKTLQVAAESLARSRESEVVILKSSNLGAFHILLT